MLVKVVYQVYDQVVQLTFIRVTNSLRSLPTVNVYIYLSAV